MRLATAAVCLALMGCQTTSEVVRDGPDGWAVSAIGVSGQSSPATEKLIALKAANQFCTGQGKQALPVTYDENEGGFARRASAMLHFRCQ